MKLSDWGVTAFFIVYLFLGLNIYKDYGISFDEPINRANGIVSIQYIGEKIKLLKPNKKIPKLHEYYDKDYGVVFDIPLVIGEKLLGYNSEEKSRELYQYRHLMTFLFFFIATIFFYLTSLKIFTNKWISRLGLIFLILSPRIFAESFYNSKDIVCLSSFIISTYFLFLFIEIYSWRSVFLFSLFTAVTINIRLTGIIVPIIALAWGTIDVYRLRIKRKNIVIKLLVYVIITAITTILFWPYLWEAPLKNLYSAFLNMSKFRANMGVLFWGDNTSATSLPWYYILVYAIVTTPILYLLMWTLGILKILKSSFKNRLLNNFESWRTQVTFLVICTAPFALVILLKSTLYDGWRQLYFTYGAFLFICLYGLEWVLQTVERNQIVLKLVKLTIIAQLLFVGVWMVINHPFQQTYFNILAPRPVDKNFEMDYWGLSYKQGLEWILKYDKRPNIKVITNLPPGIYNKMILDKSDRNRLECRYIKPSVRDTLQNEELKCDYFITEFRYRSNVRPYFKKLYSIQVDNNTILAIYDGSELTD